MARLFLSAAHKSSGKTTVTAGVAAALRARGLVVQPFKKGPDYIDPMWLTAAAGRSCRNLDFHTMGRAEIRAEFVRHGAGADLALVEGNKGLHDGVAVDGADSNAALAKLLDAPVVLVVDTRGITRGIAPLLHGYRDFDRGVRIAGVILNRVAGARHEGKLVHAVHAYTDLPVLGAVGRSADLALDAEHIGLVPPAEVAAAGDRVERIARRIEACVDLDRVRELASRTGPLADVPPAAPRPCVGDGPAPAAPRAARPPAAPRPYASDGPAPARPLADVPPAALRPYAGDGPAPARPLAYVPPAALRPYAGDGPAPARPLADVPPAALRPYAGDGPAPAGPLADVPPIPPRPLAARPPFDVRIAVARDAAFCFYYPGDLEALEAAGARVVPFDTLRDPAPPEADGIFIGGGFPERAMDDLEANASMRAALGARIAAGLPVYAECGGLMYLARRIRWNERNCEMVGAIPADVVMHPQPRGRGYVVLEPTGDAPWAPEAGGAVHAHEFHHSTLENMAGADWRYAYRVRRGRGVDGEHDGIVIGSLLASYSHLREVEGCRWTERFVSYVRGRG